MKVLEFDEIRELVHSSPEIWGMFWEKTINQIMEERENEEENSQEISFS